MEIRHRAAQIVVRELISDIENHYAHPDPDCDHCARATVEQIGALAKTRTIEAVQCLRHLGMLERQGEGY